MSYQLKSTTNLIPSYRLANSPQFHPGLSSFTRNAAQLTSFCGLPSVPSECRRPLAPNPLFTAPPDTYPFQY
ncbi:unnamed protein product [Protopolystoma xenopodis]|uniref:Uncharacterized protein n=1 Tax=Protopolystoma xenopodis TaxID=117903 RepID=A0A448XPU4_9PLAT|nr:unnamed protein product [Protopolystoma xenopodis]